MKVLKEYDQELLSSALHDLKKVYEYNYSQSSHDKVSRRLETIMKKIEELKELEIREPVSPLYYPDGRPKKSYMMCRQTSYINEVKKINGPVSSRFMCAGSRCPFYTDPMGCPKNKPRTRKENDE